MKLEQQLKEKIKQQGKANSTYETYWHWCGKYIRHLKTHYGHWKHPKECGRLDVERWLSFMANTERIGKNSQNVALQGVLYLYREVLGITIENVSAMRSQRPQMVRDVLDVSEVSRLFDHLDGVALLAARMMYASGLRIGDMIALRVKDISFERKQIAVKTAKGDKWRYVGFSSLLHEAVSKQIESVKVLHRFDQNENPNGVSLPDAIRRKAPSYASQLAWYYLFPSDTLSKGDERILCRHHRDPSHIARQIKQAAERAEIHKRVTSHVLRHSFGTHSHENGVPLATIQKLLGHADINTTMIYVHADKNGATASKSPLEALPNSVTHADAREIVAKKLAEQLDTPRQRTAPELPNNWRVVG